MELFTCNAIELARTAGVVVLLSACGGSGRQPLVPASFYRIGTLLGYTGS